MVEGCSWQVRHSTGVWTVWSKENDRSRADDQTLMRSVCWTVRGPGEVWHLEQEMFRSGL